MLRWLPKRKKASTKIEAPKSDLFPSPKDKRDYKPILGSVRLPREYELPKRVPIRNQGSLGSCASFAVVRAWELTEVNKGNNPYEGSELFHYYEGRKLQGVFPQNAGMNMRNACHTFLHFGMASEFFFPYSTTNYNNKPSWLIYAVANQVKPLRYERLDTQTQIKQSLVENIPVIFGAWTDTTFQRLNKNNYVWNPPKQGNYGHALVIVGYNSKGFIIDNSYGNAWGNNGQCIIPYAVFTKYSFDKFRFVI